MQNSYQAIINNYIHSRQCNYGDRDIHSMLEMLFFYYTEFNPLDSHQIQAIFVELEHLFQHLSPGEVDTAFDKICELCLEHERAAFREGFHVGVRLIMELESSGPSDSPP